MVVNPIHTPINRAPEEPHPARRDGHQCTGATGDAPAGSDETGDGSADQQPDGGGPAQSRPLQAGASRQYEIVDADGGGSGVGWKIPVDAGPTSLDNGGPDFASIDYDEVRHSGGVASAGRAGIDPIGTALAGPRPTYSQLDPGGIYGGAGRDGRDLAGNDGAYATLDSRTPAYAELAPHHHALYTATGGAAGGTGTGRGTTGTSARPAYNQLAEDGVYGAAERANYDTSNHGDTGVYAALDRNSSSL